MQPVLNFELLLSMLLYQTVNECWPTLHEVFRHLVAFIIKILYIASIHLNELEVIHMLCINNYYPEDLKS